MKTIGLLGGMSWESTIVYYRTINQIVNEQLGGLHSSKIILYSVDFHELNRVDYLLEGGAKVLETAGADFLVLCTNTMHRLAPQIEAATSIPLLHIVDSTAQRIMAAGLTHVGLLGTKTTMEQEFYRGHLERYSIKTTVPSEVSREIVHRIIFEELCHGQFLKSSKLEYCRIIAELANQGVGGVILGCTEIGLLVQASDTPVQLFDTTRIHAENAAHYALNT